MVLRSCSAAVLLGLLAASPALAEDARVTLRGTEVAVRNTPILVELHEPAPAPGSYELRPTRGDGAPIPAQVVREGDRATLAMVVPALGAGEIVSYTMAPSDRSSGGVAIVADGKDLRVEIDGALFTVYRAEDGPKPYFYPVIGPTGAPITRAYPMADIEGEDRDHPHQRSFWFTHGDVDGVDFWASDPINRPSPKFGTIREIARPTVVGGPVMGVIRTENAWQAPDGRVLCTDERTWRTYAVAGARVIDFDVTISAGDTPVTFEDTKEGTFGLRLASTMNVNKRRGGRIVNAEGITDTEAWGKASPWVDYSGPLGDDLVGVAILNHPDSFRYPTTWHVRDYGLFAANPFGYRDFKYADSGSHTIAPGESIRLSYRVILHEGDAEQAGIADAFKAFADPPTVEVEVEPSK